MVKEQGGRMDSSRLVTFYVKSNPKDFCCDFTILDGENKENKCGEKAIQFYFGEKGLQVPIEQNNITDIKVAVQKYVEAFINEALKEFPELIVEVDVVGD